MEGSVTAIVIRAEERKDSDYLLCLFSAEGVISAVMRGVRKASSKMKFAAQPFAFCVYELSGKGEIPVVTGATQIEDFSGIAEDIVSFSACSVMLEAARYSAAAVDCPDSFVSLLKCIKTVLYSPVSSAIVAVKYLQKLLFSSGFFRPERGELPDKGEKITSADKLCKAIAASRLDELGEIEADDDAINSALAITADKFEKFFYCTLSSARFFTGKKRSV